MESQSLQTSVEERNDTVEGPGVIDAVNDSDYRTAMEELLTDNSVKIEQLSEPPRPGCSTFPDGAASPESEPSVDTADNVETRAGPDSDEDSDDSNEILPIEHVVVKTEYVSDDEEDATIDYGSSNDREDSNPFPEVTNENETNKVFDCPNCSKWFFHLSALKRHMLCHTDKGEKKTYACMICGDTFTQLLNLQTHIKDSHPGEKGFPCPICSKGHSRLSDMKRHMKLHPGQEGVTCPICNKQFPRLYDVKRHMLTHTGEKPFSCTICSKSFSTRFNLKNHLLSHNEDKPHACRLCPKRFNYPSYLKNHMLTVHPGENPYPCTKCTESFSDQSALKSHMSTHNKTVDKQKFVCSVCKKTFAYPSYLKCHMLSHTGEKPFACKTCGKKFFRQSVLRAHERSHTGESPVCTVCSKSFTRPSDLRRHILVQHTTYVPREKSPVETS